MTSSLTQFLSSSNFCSFDLAGEAMRALREEELISGRSICTTLLSAGSLLGRSSQPLREKTMKAFSSTSFCGLPQRWMVCRMSPPTTKQNLVSRYFFLSSVSRSQVWMGRLRARLSWISSSEILILGLCWKMLCMSQKRFSMGRSNFLSSRSPQGISHTSSMPSILSRCRISFRCPRCGGSNAPPYIAMFFIILQLFLHQPTRQPYPSTACSIPRNTAAAPQQFWTMESAKKQEYDFMIKVVIIGDSGVGKTNLITRYCDNSFRDSFVSTIGVDIKVKTIAVQRCRFKMQIWDTAGQERYRNITQTYYHWAAGIILCYSVNDRNSFQSVARWIAQIDSHASAGVRKVLLATKSDLQDERTVTHEEGVALAQTHSLPFIEVSAKTGQNITEAFQLLVQQIYTKYKDNGQLADVNPRQEVLTAKNEVLRARKNCSC